jgi:hypothetical protein
MIIIYCMQKEVVVNIPCIIYLFKYVFMVIVIKYYYY